VLKRILFVDDEPSILNGLRLLLRKQRNTWDMVFVGSPREALAELDKAPFDALVSDMRMPEMDGLELVSRVIARWPATACFILSGYADPEVVQRARELARAYLNKPCELQTLLSTIGPGL
jgi:YesN/AraC family two-component response regulator